MSMYSQLLRGLLALPLLLLLAVAGVMAPEAAPVDPAIPAAVGAVETTERVVVLVRGAVPRECPRVVRRMVLASR